MNNNNRFAGKVAAVAGGNSGIGLATAKRFVSKGPYVLITDRGQKEFHRAEAAERPSEKSLRHAESKVEGS